MKLGLGLYRHQHDLEHYRFARQCGCTHVLLHLTKGIRVPDRHLREVAPAGGYAGSLATDPDGCWTYEFLARLTEEVNAAELQVGAVDQLGPMFPAAGQRKGPGKRQWLERLKTIIRDVGSVGIPVLGYDVGLPATGSRVPGRFARGDAETFGFGSRPEPVRGSGKEPALPLGGRLEECLRELLPVAAEAGVTLAAQVREPDLYETLIQLNPSVHHALEFCLTGVAASSGDGVYNALETLLRDQRIAYMLLGNVRAGPPPPHESFVDDGDIDMLRIARILRRAGYGGMIVPRHAPQMTCPAPWHVGMAHTLGYLQAAVQASEAAE